MKPKVKVTNFNIKEGDEKYLKAVMPNKLCYFQN